MKKIAIMQPYFFPYLGYFSLIKHTDRFILFDTPQFIRHGWIERNRILKQDEGWLYIKVPLVKHHRQTPIKDVQINNDQNWQSKILSQLEIYKKIAPNYNQVRELVSAVLNQEYKDIVTLNKNILEAVCKYLNIETEFSIYSAMNIEIVEPKLPDEWALNICCALGGIDEYWNSPGGETFFDRVKYEKAGIKLKFQNIMLETYNQKRTTFEPGLSIIDIMMFNTVDQVNKMLDNYELK